MPLILLGLLLLIGVLAYSIVRYINSDEEDHRSVRERYPHIFGTARSEDEDDEEPDYSRPIDADGYVDIDSLRGDFDHIARNIKENIKDAAKKRGIDLSELGRRDGSNQKPDPDESGDDPIIFPTDNVEEEKQRRNIH